MITALVLGVFFSSIFELSAVCLRYISASKENISAIECVQDRVEQLRNLEFKQLTDPDFLAVVPPVPAASPAPSPPQRRNLTVPANASELAQNATEEVTISTYSGSASTTPEVTFTRTPGAKINTSQNFADTDITPTRVWTGGASLAGASIVQVDVTYRWTARFGNRQRSETSSTIVAAGAKK